MNLAEPNRDVGTRTEGVPNINIWAPYKMYGPDA